MRALIPAFFLAFSLIRFAILFRFTAIAVNLAWKDILRKPQPVARASPWKRFISAFFHSTAARFLYFVRNSGDFWRWLS